MPKRPCEGPLPYSEPIYRSLEEHHVRDGQVTYASLQPVSEVSFNRHAYDPECERLIATWGEHIGIATMVCDAKLSEPIERQGPPKKPPQPYIIYGWDDPNPSHDPDNDAHCEVRVRVGLDVSGYEPNLKIKDTHKNTIRERIAKRLKIVRAPKPKPPEPDPQSE